MPVRQARYRDLPQIYSVLSSAFRIDNFQRALFPYIDEHSADYERAWRHATLESYWDYRKIFAVSFDIDEQSGQEVIKAVSIWSRHGDGWESLWGIKGWWDPRLLIKRMLAAVHALHRNVFPNRASVQPTPANPKPLTNWTWLEAIKPYSAHYFTPPSLVAVATGQTNTPSTSAPQTASTTNLLTPDPTDTPQPTPNPRFWELAVMGTHPSSHGQGHGRTLVQAGLARARAENLPAVVVAAEGKERFYQRCGFWNLVGYATDGDENPIRALEIGGGGILWTEGPAAGREIEVPRRREKVSVGGSGKGE